VGQVTSGTDGHSTTGGHVITGGQVGRGSGSKKNIYKGGSITIVTNSLLINQNVAYCSPWQL